MYMPLLLAMKKLLMSYLNFTYRAEKLQAVVY
jgi:hypothetical protein